MSAWSKQIETKHSILPLMRASMASWMGWSKICRCRQTSTTRRTLDCTSLVEPRYAFAVASATI